MNFFLQSSLYIPFFPLFSILLPCLMVRLIYWVSLSTMSSPEEGLECLHKPILSGILSTLRLNLFRVQILTGRDFLSIYIPIAKLRKKTVISKLNNLLHSGENKTSFLPRVNKHFSILSFFHPVEIINSPIFSPPRVNIPFSLPE